MPINFDQCEVYVNSQRILADSASISEENSVAPNYAVGYINPFDNTPNGAIKNTFQFNYTLETDNEPVFTIMTGLKSYQNSYNPAQISVGGIVGSGFLEGYSLDISENNEIRATANFVCFQELSGTLAPQSNPSTNNYKIGHYWTTYPILSNGATGSLIKMNYSFKANWEPTYTLGNKNLNQITLLNAQESIDITSETISHIRFTGEKLLNSPNNLTNLQINNILTLTSGGNAYSQYNLNIPLSGFIINQNKVGAKTDNIITVTTQANKFY